jgi:hypothetical protein
MTIGGIVINSLTLQFDAEFSKQLNIMERLLYPKSRKSSYFNCVAAKGRKKKSNFKIQMYHFTVGAR